MERGTKRSRSTNSPELNIEVSNVKPSTEIESLRLTKTEEQLAKKAKKGDAPLDTRKSLVQKTNITLTPSNPSKTLSAHLSVMRK